MALLLTLDHRGGAGAVSLHTQLERELRERIRAGRLEAGTRLPATRELAQRLGVSRGVVVEAYAQLAAEGYLSTRRGAGTVVAGTTRTPEAPPPVLSERAAPEDLHPGLPDLAAFPRAAWARSLRTVTRELPDAAFGYPDPSGAAVLRVGLARYLGRARGVAAEPARLLIVSGLTQGLTLLARALLRRGARRVAVEDPGFFVHRWALAHAGLEVVPVAVDEHGLRTDLLARVEADAVLVTPAHQAPLGGVLRAARREALLLWAERRGALVIEDDYDAEYRYDRDPVGAVQGLAPERVAYLGCASKVLAPALRIGWLALPAAWAETVAVEKALDDLGTPLLDQHALADFIERGELDRHLRRMRPRYRARRATLVAALARELPEWRVAGVAAGFGVVALPPAATDERALIAAAARRGMVLHGLARYRVAPGPPGLVLGIGNTSEPALARAVKQLAGAYEEVT
ncbi:PLP-dependent aminotransferase family protein [Conexibacter sp. JD483]|uniref:MocR-like pyridoxine biosynthesis transcription factor PdxR n=1 Tax=unclassified Conexibacter TaxID=2627773 RepID=UPI002718FF58|nr:MULTISPECIES: PLP-dependent aminotransferase family protein [unclassified Conexibacter]MDO8186728.1 PLP-dependent aminotransferase family protein [Conexibacter sp. CPCC 205706]MDO8199014.1 PLP-dependent aminotransferase family protein [Conexibacter sp. CPCC 205762]MDR9368466.1 PLP-dependent aminotransferase family protein [Conexibacter sp. JD483]